MRHLLSGALMLALIGASFGFSESASAAGMNGIYRPYAHQSWEARNSGSPEDVYAD